MKISSIFSNRSSTLQYYNRTILTGLLVGVFLLSLIRVPWQSGLIHGGGGETFLEILVAMVQPQLSWELLRLGAWASFKTLAYATCGISLAVAIAVPAGILASGVLGPTPTLKWLMRLTVRPVLGGMRAIHELVWAWLLVAGFGLSPIVGVIGLAIPYAGILGRILADKLNDVPEEPLESLATTGAGPIQTLLFGRIPMALPEVISYTMFRWECAIRSAAIMSFVGLGGLGYQIQISLDDLHFAEAWTFVYFLVALVIAMSWWSNRVREQLTA